jgi:FKBP-type peptidyl-prolyl cis-trans isomerase (trigger factor)
MKKETWMGAAEAVERKFADSIVGKSAVDIGGKGAKSETNNRMSILDRLLPNGELTAKLEAANGELVNAANEIQTLTNKLKEADAVLAEAADELREFKAKAETAEAQAKADKEAREVAEALAKPEVIEAKALELVASVEAPEAIANAISAKAAEMIASAGHPAVDEIINDSDANKKLSRASFNNLSHPKRNAFIREGGKITE